MALVGDDLGLAMKAAVDALSDADKRDRTKVFKAMGNAITTYLVAHTQVAVVSVSGVTPGGGVSGPGTGTIS